MTSQKNIPDDTATAVDLLLAQMGASRVVPNEKRVENERAIEGLKDPLLLDDLPTDVDQLGRTQFADLLAMRITDKEAKTPFCIGIDGEWGSGKTSLCLSIVANIKNSKQNTITCMLNAWRFESVRQLAEAFVDELLRGIAKVLEGAADGKKAIDTGDLNLGARFQSQWSDLAQRAQSETRWLSAGTETLLTDLCLAIFPEEAAKKAEPRLVVFVDDLDRCSPRQLEATLKFLRPFLGARNVVMILPAWKQRVVDTLRHLLGNEHIEGEARGSDETSPEEVYLERLVRVWVTLPTPNNIDIDTYLTQYIQLEESHDEYARIVANLVGKNPRQLKGMINAFRITRDYALKYEQQAFGTNLAEELLHAAPTGLRPHATMFKLFLLRHFWPDLFEAIRRDPKLLLVLQAAREQTGATDAPVVQILMDENISTLLHCGPRWHDSHFDSTTSGFIQPLATIVHAAQVSAPAVTNRSREFNAAIRNLTRSPIVQAIIDEHLLRARPDQFRLNQFINTVLQRSGDAKILGDVAAKESSTSTLLPPSPAGLTPRVPNGQQMPGTREDGPGVAAAGATADGAPGVPAGMGVQTPPTQPRTDMNGMIVELQKYWMLARQGRQASDHAVLQAQVPGIRRVIADVRFAMASGVATHNSQLLRNISSALGNIGVTYETSNEPLLAEEFYRAGIDIAPDYAGTHVQYADFLSDLGRLAEARDQLETAKRLDPQDRRIPGVDAKLSLRESANDPTMRDKIRQQVEENPGNSAVVASYLMMLSELNDPSVAPEFERVCRLWEMALPPEDKTDARRALADFYARIDRDADAIAIYREILPKLHDPEDIRATLHNLATEEAVTGDRESALEHWKRAYAMNRGDEQLRAGFVSALVRWDMYDVALKVSQGLPLDDDPSAPPQGGGHPSPSTPSSADVLDLGKSFVSLNKPLGKMSEPEPGS